MKIDGITIANQEKGMALHRFRLHPTVNSKHINHNYILHLIKVRRWHRFGFSDWLSYKVINWAAQHGWAKNKNKLNPNRCHYLLITYLTFDVGFTGKSFSEAIIYFSINPKYSIPLLGRFTSIIHQNYISRTPTLHRLFYLLSTDEYCHMYNLFTFFLGTP